MWAQEPEDAEAHEAGRHGHDGHPSGLEAKVDISGTYDGANSEADDDAPDGKVAAWWQRRLGVRPGKQALVLPHPLSRWGMWRWRLHVLYMAMDGSWSALGGSVQFHGPSDGRLALGHNRLGSRLFVQRMADNASRVGETRRDVVTSRTA